MPGRVLRGIADWLKGLGEELGRFADWMRLYAAGISWSLAFAALLLNAGLSYQNFRAIDRNSERVVAQFEHLLAMDGVLSALREAESGQRGFLITGNPVYLDQYRTILAQINLQLAQLQDILQDDPRQAERFFDLEQLIQLKVAEMRSALEVLDRNGREAAYELIKGDVGKQYMDQIQTRMAVMRRHERDVMSERTAAARESRSRAWVILLTGSLVVIGMTIAAFLAVRRQMAYQRAMEAQLRQANEELEQRVLHRTEALRATNESLREEVVERMRLEEQAQENARELARSNRELELFASVASHDLQEPLRKIQAFADRLQTRSAAQLDERGREYLTRIDQSAARMRRLIEDLLAYARVSTQARPFAPVDLDQIAREAISDLEERMARTGAEVHIGPLPTIEADASQIRQLFLNLIGNSLKFHRPGVPPRIHVQARLLPGVDHEQSASCELTIEDNGIGFENEYVQRIFQLFQRLHGGSEYEGTGMGLAICKKIVERHRGTITARGRPGSGAAFVVVLPLHAGPASAFANGDLQRDGPPGEPGVKRETLADVPTGATDHHSDGR